MSVFAVGAMVEAQKNPNMDSWFRAKIVAYEEPGRYLVSFPLREQWNCVLPESQVRGIVGGAKPSSASAGPRRASALAAAAERRAARATGEVTTLGAAENSVAVERRPSAMGDRAPSAALAVSPEEVSQPRPLEGAGMGVADTWLAIQQVEQRLKQLEMAWLRKWDEREERWARELVKGHGELKELEQQLTNEIDKVGRQADDHQSRIFDHEDASARLETQLQTFTDDFNEHLILFQTVIKPLQDGMKMSEEDIDKALGQLTALSSEMHTVQAAQHTHAQRLDALQGEGVDQRDAMGSLMDILEKTVTIDDASELDDQLRALIKQQGEELREQIDSQGQKIVGLLENHEAATAAATEAAGVALEAAADELMQNIESLGVESANGDKALQQSLEEVRGDLAAAEERLGELATTEVDIKLANMVEEIDVKRQQSEQRLTEVVGDQKHDTKAALERLDTEAAKVTDLSDLRKDMQLQVNNLQTKLDGSKEELDFKIGQVQQTSKSGIIETRDDLSLHIENVNTSLQQLFRSGVNSLEAHIQQLSERTDSEMSEAYSRMNSMREEQRVRVDDGHDHILQQVDKEVREVAIRNDENLKRYVAEQERLEKSLEETQSKHDEMEQRLQTRQDLALKQTAEKVDVTISDLQTGVSDFRKEVQTLVAEVDLDKTVTHAAIARVDEKILDMVRKTVGQISDQRTYFSNLATKAEKHVAAVAAETAKSVRVHTGQVTQSFNELASSVGGHKERNDRQLQELATSMETFNGQILETNSKLDNRISDLYAERTVEMKKQENRLNEEFRKIEKRTFACEATVKDNIETARRHIDEKMRELQSGLERGLGDCGAEIRDTKQQTAEATKLIDDNFRELVTRLHTTFDDRLTDHEVRVVSLEEEAKHAKKVAQDTAAQVEKTDRMLTDHMSKVDKTVNKIEKTINTRRAEIDESHRQLAESVRESVRDTFSRMEDSTRAADFATEQLSIKVAAMEKRREETHTILVGRIGNLEEEAVEAQVQLKAQCKVTEDRMAERCKATEARLTNHQHQIAEDNANLERKIVDKANAQDEKMKLALGQAADIVKNQDLKLSESNIAQKIVDRDLRDSTAAVEKNVAAQLASIEKRVASKEMSTDKVVSDIRHQLQEQKQQWNAELLQVSTAQHEALTNIQKDIDGCRHDSRLAHDTLERTLAQTMQEQSDRREDLRQSVLREIADLHEQCAPLEEQLRDLSNGHSKLIAQLTASVKENRDELKQDVNACERSVTSVSQELKSLMGSVDLYVRNDIDNLGLNFDTFTSKLQEELNALDKYVISQQNKSAIALSEQDSRLSLLCSANEHKIVETRSQVLARLDAIEQSVETNGLDFKSQFTALRSSVTETAKASQTQAHSIAVQFTNGLDSLTARAEQLQQSLQSSCDETERALTEKNTAQDKVVGDLARTVIEHHRQQQDATLRIEKSITDQNLVQDNRNDKQLQQITSQLQNLALKLTDQTHVNTESLRKLENSTREKHEEIEHKIQTVAVELDEKLTAHSHKSEDACTSLTSTLTDLSNRVSENEQLRLSSMDQITKLLESNIMGCNNQLRNSEDRLFAVTSSLGEVIEKNMEECILRADNIDERVTAKYEDNSRAITELGRTTQDDKRQLTDSLAAHKAEHLHRISEQDRRLEAQDNALRDKLDGLELKFSENHETLLRSILENSDTAARNNGNLTRSVKSLESRFGDLSSSQDDRLSRNHDHFTQVLVQMNEVIQERFETIEAQSTDRVEVNRDKIESIAAQSDAKVDELRTELRTTCATISNKCHELDLQYDHGQAEQKLALDNEREHCEQLCEQLSKQGSEREDRDARRHSELVTRLDKSIGQITAHQAEIDARVRSDFAEHTSLRLKAERRFDELCTKLGKSIGAVKIMAETEASATRNLVESGTRQASTELRRLEGATASRIHELKETAAANAQRTDLITERLENRADKTDEVARHASSLGSEVQKHVASLAETVDARMSLEEKTRSEAVDELRKATHDNDGRARQTEQLLQQQLQAEAELSSRLADEIADNHRALLEQLDQQQAAASDDKREVAERMDEQHQLFTAACLKLDSSVNAVATNLRNEAARTRQQTEAYDNALESCRKELQAALATEAVAVRRELATVETSVKNLGALQNQITESATKKELKMGTQLIQGDIDELTAAVRELGSAVPDIEKKLEDGLTNLDENVQELGVDFALLEVAVSDK